MKLPSEVRKKAKQKGPLVLVDAKQVLAVWDLAVRAYRDRLADKGFYQTGRYIGAEHAWVELTGLNAPNAVGFGY